MTGRPVRADWLRGERGALAAERILDAAERVFAEHGISATEMSHVAKAAGCSRATLYRYFESKHELRVAYMHRQTRQVARRVADSVRDIDDPGRRLVDAMLAALAQVRDTPGLAAWFTRSDSGHTAELAGASPVLRTVCATFLGDPADPDNQARARWLLRVIVSLLSAPGRDAVEERELIERFVVPVVLGSARTEGREA
jgi:AcrR family transcriptional regulator